MRDGGIGGRNPSALDSCMSEKTIYGAVFDPLLLYAIQLVGRGVTFISEKICHGHVGAVSVEGMVGLDCPMSDMSHPPSWCGRNLR